MLAPLEPHEQHAVILIQPSLLSAPPLAPIASLLSQVFPLAERLPQLSSSLHTSHFSLRSVTFHSPNSPRWPSLSSTGLFYPH